MDQEKIENFTEERLKVIKTLTTQLNILPSQLSDLKQLKDLLRITFLEKNKENGRIIKEDNYIESFFLMHSITTENLKYIYI